MGWIIVGISVIGLLIVLYYVGSPVYFKGPRGTGEDRDGFHDG